MNIPAITCTPQYHDNVGDRDACTTSNTARVTQGSQVPCMVRAISGAGAQTYVCPLSLPNGALIEEIILRGTDQNPHGYIEGAVARWSLTSQSPFPSYISPTFGGNWQHTDVATASSSYVNVPLYLDSDTPHTMHSSYSYGVMFAVHRITPQIAGTVRVNGIRVKYTIQ